MNTPIILDDVFQGHIILFCKGHYNTTKYTFFESLRMIWAIRCGYDYEQTNMNVDSYIAQDLWSIIKLCAPNRFDQYMDNFHREVGNQAFYKPQNMTPIQAIIWEYRSIISNLTIKEKVNTNYKPLIILPKPMKRVFNRILNGNGRYKDYWLINPKT